MQPLKPGCCTSKASVQTGTAAMTTAPDRATPTTMEPFRDETSAQEAHLAMERASRRDRSRDPEDDPSSDTGASTRLRSRRARDTRSSAADSTSDGADTDASTAGQADAPQRRQRRRSNARKAAEEPRKAAEVPRKSTRELRSADERHSSRSGDEEEEDNDDHEDNGGRKRSMSNVSNTSSTSASSMASESLTEEQRRARLDQQVAELKQKKKMVEDGTLAEFCRRVAAFKEERNRLLQTAELHKNLQLKNGQDLYKFEVQRAHHLWQNERKVLKEELLAKTDAVMATLQAEMKALSEPGAKVAEESKKPEQKSNTSANLADKPSVVVAIVKGDKDDSKNTSEPEQEEGEVPEPPAAAQETPMLKRRKMDPSTMADPVDVSKLLPVEAVRLPFDDATSDIAAIVSDRVQTSKLTVERLPNAGNCTICIATPFALVMSWTNTRMLFTNAVPFKLERRRLLCGKYLFEDGDEVQVLMPLVHEDYTGTISSITDDAIYIKLASGQKTRIFLPHLERRRCELKPLLRGTPSTGSLQSMGWTEYDTLY
ncbi:unnamed protein product [Phytophthora lilii]|uniref:Unnamed protein product n=1 Tax=Phytophthora lilii TaxID=2077276 RepID=A0A9W6YDG2_9STRA|nr:unnamed protein product [Phytophthora lilii]